MMKVYSLKDPLFLRSIKVLVGGDESTLNEYLKRRFGEDVKMMNKGEECEDEGVQLSNDGMEFYVEDEDQQYFFVWLSKPTIDNVHHEIHHLTLDVLHNAGVTLSDDSEEVYTYWGANVYLQAFNKLFSVKPKRS